MSVLFYWLVYVPSVVGLVVGGNTAFARHDAKRLRQSITACHCHCELVHGTSEVWMKPLLTSQETEPHHSHFTGASVICGTSARLDEIRRAIAAAIRAGGSQ